MSPKRRPLFEVDRLSKLFPLPGSLFGGPKLLRAVDNVSLFIRHGETLGIVGESPSGKSVLAQTMLRLISPSYGRIKFKGKDITHTSGRSLRQMRKEVQIVFQDPSDGLDRRMRVRDVVAEPMRAHGVLKSRAEIAERAALLLGRMGLTTDVATKLPVELSSGERQRVQLARALSTDPVLLVLDQPLSEVDAATSREILSLLTESQEEHRTSLAFISHDLGAVRRLSHRVAVMYFGRIVEVGEAEDVFERPLHPYTRALVATAPSSATKLRLRVLLEGPPPDPFAPPEGCSFHPRCGRAEAGHCDVEVPDLAAAEEGSRHRAACFYPHG